jgi:DNA-binding response OmpR family regulator
MHRIMVIAPAGENEAVGKIAADLVELDYEVLRPAENDPESLKRLEQVDLFVLVGQRQSVLEGLARTLSGDELLSETPALVVTDEKTLEKFDYCRLADDILLLPYRRAELAARIRLLMWHNHKVDPSLEVRSGDLVINLSTYEVTAGGRHVDLTFKEYELLRYLATHRGRVCTRHHLLAKVWGEDYFGGARTVDVHIRRIRSKIETGDRTYIQTVRSVGYRFVD